MNESYWTYRADKPRENAPPDYPMTREEWQSLTPGMRREIWRQYDKEQNGGRS